MKKTIIKVLSFVMASAMVFGSCFVANAAPACEHDSYTVMEHKEATCTEWGYTAVKCNDCDEAFYLPGEAQVPPHIMQEGFVLQNKEVVAPTCSSEGYTTGICSICELSIKIDEVAIDPDAHDWDIVTVENDCTNAGGTVKTCKLCGTEEKTDVGATGHNWAVDEDSIVPPTCVAEGEITFYCANENCTVTKTVVILKGEYHQFEDVDAERPDCETPGHTEGRHCVLCGADDPDSDKDVSEVDPFGHSMNLDTFVPATCTTSGLKTHKCADCGYTESEIIPAHGHTIWVIAGKEATCEEEGLTEGRYCEGCNTTFVEQVVIPKGPHKNIEDVPGVAPTCSSVGYTAGTMCTLCHAAIKDREEIPMLEHANVVVLPGVEADCDNTGLTEGSKCDDCGEIIVAQVEIAALGHNYISVACTTENKIITYCSRCEDPDQAPVEDYIPLEGAASVESHIYIKDESRSEPTSCLVSGWDYKVCKCCGAEVKEKVAALGHELEIHEVAATCVAPGYKYVKCKVCFAQISNVEYPIDEENGHIYQAVGAPVLPTCTEDGYQNGKCIHCGTSAVITLPAHHTEIVVPGKAATCDTDGYTEHRACSVCGEELSSKDILPAFGHTVVEVPAIAPTCISVGYEAYSYCAVCGKETAGEADKEIAKLPHDVVVDAKVDATCTTDGLTEGSHCGTCGEVLVEQTVIPAAHVTVIDIPAVAPDCRKEGATAGTACGICGEILTGCEPVAKLDHDITYSVTRDPSCENGGHVGFTYNQCTLCVEYVDDYKEKLEHAWEESKVDPDCEHDGYDGRKCNVCGEEEGTPLDATHHQNAGGQLFDSGCVLEDIYGNPLTDFVCVNPNCPYDDGIVPKHDHETLFDHHVDPDCMNHEHDVFICTYCGHIEYANWIMNRDPNAHKYVIVDKTADASVNAAQKITYKCSVEGCDSEPIVEYVTAGIINASVAIDNAVTPGYAIVNSKGQVNATISLKGDMEEFEHLVFEFKYDTEFFTFDKNNVTVNTEKFGDVEVYDNGGVIRIYINSQYVDGKVANAVLSGTDEDVVVLSFTVKSDVLTDKDNAVNTSSAFELTFVQGALADESPITSTVTVNAIDAVEIFKLGDVNGDGKVDSLDTTRLRKMIMRELNDNYSSVADIDGDGVVEMADFAKLSKYIVGAISYEDLIGA